MKFFILSVVLSSLLVICVCQTPTRPVISTFFDARILLEVRIKSDNSTIRGDGRWIIDQPKGLGLENFFFHNRSHHSEVVDLYRLQRYDLGYIYQMDNATYCNKTEVSGRMPVDFAWLAIANYSGQRVFRNRTFDIWSFDTGYAKMELYVNNANVNIPVFLTREYREFTVLSEFAHFGVIHPDDRWFRVPDVCNTAQVSKAYDLELISCESRSTIISRAQSWVSAHVPYNQGATYGGYREDCSGYVSMAWEATKPGYTTFTMHEISHPITRAQLQPGDILLCASEHVVLFGGWVDSDHYTAYEETKPGEGTVKRTTPYPYWYNTACFLPYRYNSVC